MKKKLLLMSVLAIGLFTMSACSSDNESKTEDGVTIADEEYDAIITQYVDEVVMPTYADLLAKNVALYQTVLSFGNAPSDANFQAVCNAWLTAREPWESSEAFLFGPVADYGLDPNMDSWPLDQEAIVGVLQSEDWNSMEWTGDYDEDDESIEEVQSIRGFHTLEFLAFKDGKARTLNDVSEDGSAANIVYNVDNATAWAQYMRNTA